jgi:hypothetical protein
MFICKDCGAFFPTPKVVKEKESYEAWGYNFTQEHSFDACPCCGSYDINEAPEEADED